MTNNFLFWVVNTHAPEAGQPPHVDGTIRKRYHGYFENEYGEQAIFVIRLRNRVGYTLVWRRGLGTFVSCR